MDEYYIKLKKEIIKDSNLSKYSKQNLLLYLYDANIEICKNEKQKKRLINEKLKLTEKFGFSPALNLCEAFNLTHQDNKHDFGHGKTSLKYNTEQVNSLAAGDMNCMSSIENISEIDYLNKVLEFYGSGVDGYTELQYTFDELNDPTLNSIEETLKYSIPNLDAVYCIIDTTRPSFLNHIAKTNQNVEKPFWWVCQTMQTLFDAAGKLNYFGYKNKNNYSIFNRDDGKNPNVGFCWQDPIKTKVVTYSKWPADPTGKWAGQTDNPKEMLDIKADIEMFWNSEIEETNSEKYANDFRKHSSCIYMKGPDNVVRWADTVLASKTQNRQYAFFKAIKTFALQVMGISQKEKDASIQKELKELKYREDFHFLAKRCGDATQANACTEPFLHLRTDYGGTIQQIKSNGIHNFVSYDSLACAAALIYGSPIVTKCYSKLSTEFNNEGKSFSDGCSVWIRGDLLEVTQTNYNQLVSDSKGIVEILISFSDFNFNLNAPKIENIRLVPMRKGSVQFNWVNNLSDGVFMFDASSTVTGPISQLPVKVLETGVWNISEPPFVYRIKNDSQPIDFKIFLYIYIFALEYYKTLSKLESQYEELKLLFSSIPFPPAPSRQELIKLTMDQFPERDLVAFPITNVEFKNKKDLLTKIRNFGSHYKKLLEETQLYQTSFYPSGENVPYLFYSDLVSKVNKFSTEFETNIIATRRKKLIEQDKYMSYKELLYPLTQGPFGYYNRYKSVKWGAPNNEYYNTLWLKINEIAMIEAIKTGGNGFQGQFYKDFDKIYFPRSETDILKNSFSPRPLDLKDLNYGVGLSTEIRKSENDRLNIPSEEGAIPPRQRIPFTDEDIYICILNSAVDILPFLKINTDTVAKQIEDYKNRVDTTNPELFSISNINIKNNAKYSEYRYRLFSDFLSFVGGVLGVELKNLTPITAWAPQETLNRLNAQFPGQITPETICSTDRADIYRLCFNERFSINQLSEVEYFYNHLLVLCTVWDDNVSAVDFLINFVDKRINYLDFVTKPVDKSGNLQNGFGWTEDILDKFIYFDGLFLDTNCLFYKYFVKDYLFYSGLIDFSPENVNTGITKFAIENYPELINIDSSGNYQSILQNIII
jgi:hypothetical protein